MRLAVAVVFLLAAAALVVVPALPAGALLDVDSSVGDANVEVSVPIGEPDGKGGIAQLSVDTGAVDGLLGIDAAPLAVRLGSESRAAPRSQTTAYYEPQPQPAAAPAAVGALAVATSAGGMLPALLQAMAPQAEALWAFVRRGGRSVAAALPGAFLSPLFSRIEPEQVLKNEVRQRMHAAIQGDPGLSIASLQERSNIAWGTAVYHLQRLERHGLVVSVRQGGSRRYFPANSEAARHREAIAALAHPTTSRVALYVRGNAGTDQAGLCRGLTMLNPAASKQLSRLEALGLVISQRSGRSRLYWPTEPLESLLSVMNPQMGRSESMSPPPTQPVVFPVRDAVGA